MNTAGFAIPCAARPQEYLGKPLTVGAITVPNRLCSHPMEGCDADEQGLPTELTLRRYKRLAAGGAGLIWVEACAVHPSGKGNPRQLQVNSRTASGLREIMGLIQGNAVDARGAPQRPAVILQLTHSGRYSKPDGIQKPLIVHHSDILDKPLGISATDGLLSDHYLEGVVDWYVQAASIAHSCGFDGVDIKACHGYLLHELLYSRSRQEGHYGGSFENRTRLLRTIVERVREECPKLAVAVRLSLFDGIPYPWGWGTEADGTPAIQEPIQLIQALKDEGVDVISVAVGNPYYNPHVERPYDRSIVGGHMPEETPLESILRIMQLTAEVHRAVPNMPLVGTGLSWLRHLVPHVAAGLVREEWIALAGLGRQAIANPGFANDILRHGTLPLNRLCIACSGCVQLMRDGGRSGCVVHDSEIYAAEYRSARLGSRKSSDSSM